MQKHYIVKEAQVELDRLVAMDTDLTAEVGQLDRQLAELEESAGSRNLAARAAGDQTGTQQIADELLQIKSKRDLTTKTMMAARTAITIAKHEVLMAGARELRAQAAALVKTANARQKLTDKLLHELQEYEGVGWMPIPPVHPSGVFVSGMRGVTKTMEILTEAEILIRQAETWSSNRVDMSPNPHVMTA